MNNNERVCILTWVNHKYRIYTDGEPEVESSLATASKIC